MRRDPRDVDTEKCVPLAVPDDVGRDDVVSSWKPA